MREATIFVAKKVGSLHPSSTATTCYIDKKNGEVIFMENCEYHVSNSLEEYLQREMKFYTKDDEVNFVLKDEDDKKILREVKIKR